MASNGYTEALLPDPGILMVANISTTRLEILNSISPGMRCSKDNSLDKVFPFTFKS